MYQNNMYSQDVSTVNFYGDRIVTVKSDDGRIMVAIRPIVENLGLAWEGQRVKLIEAQTMSLTEGYYDRFRVESLQLAIDGESVSMLCIELKRLNAFLFTLNPNRVPDLEVRTRIIKYQEECVTVLHDYWLHGAAVNGRKNPSDIDSGYKDARAFSRPALVAACTRMKEYAAKAFDVEIDPEDLYHQMITYAYIRTGINPVGIGDKTPLAATQIESGYLSLKLAFVECAIVAVLNHVVAYDRGVNDIMEFVTEHVNTRMNEVGNEILALADFVPASMYEDPQLGLPRA